eukprot:GHVQ01014255.1.p1 GENE.GHVQ01014255.1~~GHVQ01014255.1.p1  ORF type:complete len:956 (-),score=171.26 GHVQ01014255.1:39-2771(-)
MTMSKKQNKHLQLTQRDGGERAYGERVRKRTTVRQLERLARRARQCSGCSIESPLVCVAEFLTTDDIKRLVCTSRILRHALRSDGPTLHPVTGRETAIGRIILPNVTTNETGPGSLIQRLDWRYLRELKLTELDFDEVDELLSHFRHVSRHRVSIYRAWANSLMYSKHKLTPMCPPVTTVGSIPATSVAMTTQLIDAKDNVNLNICCGSRANDNSSNRTKSNSNIHRTHSCSNSSSHNSTPSCSNSSSHNSTPSSSNCCSHSTTPTSSSGCSNCSAHSPIPSSTPSSIRNSSTTSSCIATHTTNAYHAHSIIHTYNVGCINTLPATNCNVGSPRSTVTPAADPSPSTHSICSNITNNKWRFLDPLGLFGLVDKEIRNDVAQAMAIRHAKLGLKKIVLDKCQLSTVQAAQLFRRLAVSVHSLDEIHLRDVLHLSSPHQHFLDLIVDAVSDVNYLQVDAITHAAQRLKDSAVVCDSYQRNEKTGQQHHQRHQAETPDAHRQYIRDAKCHTLQHYYSNTHSSRYTDSTQEIIPSYQAQDMVTINSNTSHGSQNTNRHCNRSTHRHSENDAGQEEECDEDQRSEMATAVANMMLDTSSRNFDETMQCIKILETVYATTTANPPALTTPSSIRHPDRTTHMNDNSCSCGHCCNRSSGSLSRHDGTMSCSCGSNNVTDTPRPHSRNSDSANTRIEQQLTQPAGTAAKAPQPIPSATDHEHGTAAVHTLNKCYRLSPPLNGSSTDTNFHPLQINPPSTNDHGPFSSLKALSVTSCMNSEHICPITEAATEAILQLCYGSRKTLHTLDLSGVLLVPEWSPTVDLLITEALPSLRRLHLDSCHLSDSVLAGLLLRLHVHLPHLHFVSVRHNSGELRTAQVLAQIILSDGELVPYIGLSCTLYHQRLPPTCLCTPTAVSR